MLCLTKKMGIYVLKGFLKKLFGTELSIQNKSTNSWLQINLRYLSDQNIKANIQGTNLFSISISYNFDITSKDMFFVTTIPETRMRRAGFLHY